MVGNQYSRGNPLNKKVQKLRAELVNAVSEQDIRDIAQKLIQAAKKGSVSAASELLNRLFGRAHQSLEVSKLPPPDDSVRFLSTAELMAIASGQKLDEE